MLRAVRPPALALTKARVTKGALVTDVHDGDTLTVDIDLRVYTSRTDQDLGFHMYVQRHHLHRHESVRLFGLNAPELSTADGKRAREALLVLVPVGTKVTLTTWLNKADKYGRLLANIRRGKIDVNQWLIDNDVAAPWDGHGPKPVPT